MFKRIISVLLVITMFFTLTGFSFKKEPEIDLSTPEAKIAQSVLEYPATNEDFRYDVYTYYVTITECLSTKNNIVIPDTIQDLPVYKIADSTFRMQSTITSVTMTNNIIEIGKSAFAGCENLESINLSKNLKTCGSSAFFNCNNIKSVTIPGSLNEIPSSMFADCERLTAVIIEEQTQKQSTDEEAPVSTVERTIGSSAFAGCKILKNVWIPTEITTIEDSAFSGSMDNLIIYGQAQSSAAHYASEHLVDFVVLGKNEFQNILNSAASLESKKIGDTISGSTWKITFDKVYSFREDFAYDANGRLRTKKLTGDREVLVFCFTVKNLSGSSQTINLLDINTEADEYQKKISTFGKISHSQLSKYDRPLVGLVDGNSVIYGYVAVEVPAGWSSASVQFANDTQLESFRFDVKSSDSKVTYIGTADNPAENLTPEGSLNEPVTQENITEENTITEVTTSTPAETVS